MIIVVDYSNIYVFTNKINGMKYVGQSINPSERYKQHFKDSGKDNLLFHNALIKYGEDEFEFEIIEENIPLNIVGDREKYWIAMLNSKKPNGYNLTDGGEGTFGFKHTEESKLKMSITRKGVSTHKQSPETRAKISAAHKGRKCPPEFGRKLSQIKKGNTFISDETRAKLSKALKGKPHSEEHNKRVCEGLRNMSTEAKLEQYKKAIETKRAHGVDFGKHFREMNEEEKQLMYEKVARNNPRSTHLQGENIETHEVFTFCSIGRAGQWLHDEFGCSIHAKVAIRNSIKRNGTAYGFKWTYITHAS